MNRRAFTPRVILAVVLGAAIAWLAMRGDIDMATLEAGVRNFGIWAPVVFVLAYAAATVLFIPGSVLALAGGGLFGPVWGTLWNLVGATLGATLAFLVARYVGSDWVAKKAGERLGRIIAGVEAEGWRFVAFVRLVPLFPFNLLNYALGLTRIRLGQYVATSFVCMLPGAIAYTYLGYAGREAAVGSAGAIQKGLLALGLLAAVAFLPRLVRRLRSAQDFVDASDLKQRLDRGDEVVVVDVRGADEFEGPLGHITGARNIPLAELPAKLHGLADLKGRPLVLVCRTDKRSAKAAVMLKDAGFRSVSVLRNGMERWNEAGFPVERRSPTQ